MKKYLNVQLVIEKLKHIEQSMLVKHIDSRSENNIIYLDCAHSISKLIGELQEQMEEDKDVKVTDLNALRDFFKNDENFI